MPDLEAKAAGTHAAAQPDSLQQTPGDDAPGHRATAVGESLKALFDANKTWAQRMESERPGFFKRLQAQQNPRYMWIGCSDSRVPANQITGLEPGEVFVHRNVANLFLHSDLNALSTVQFAVERLGVAHVIVVGHYGCSGVLAALESARIGLADNWLRHIQDVRDRHQAILERFGPATRHDRLVELNVIEQVRHVGQSTVVLDAWARGHQLSLHGWVYGIGDGLLQDMEVSASDPGTLNRAYAQALARIAQLEVPHKAPPL
ncbi:MAG: carbonate dehydratase [Betaproteobacteria bacterium]|jgi:carbonic anhydrase|nr:carbonate dehydratase [Pseudomonadota bacterium]NBO02583.1 carbonate dehydratase [Betaproteobacteria bacterium]HAB47528.1 carbonate dehydratase [Lautropia sp.]NBO96825.1 carbonate dehydratase [Betaproteobacteria bacterium]NBP33935.1 carbonate dehydratase [Betaproteobacteria bacterium]